jgi:hypothetical protein
MNPNITRKHGKGTKKIKSNHPRYSGPRRKSILNAGRNGYKQGKKKKKKRDQSSHLHPSSSKHP